jgi:hypothetical protein
MFGMTTWKASDALPPCAVGSVSRSTIFSCSMNEPGHPWLTMSGSAFSCLADVDEVDVQAVDLSHELRYGVQLRLALAPVVLVVPVPRDRLHRRERHTLRLVVDGLLLGPARGRDARAQVLEIRLGDLASVGLHRDLADTEPRSDLLVQQAGNDQRHDFSFARRQ